MSTLKICTMTKTQWLPEVRSVERLASFTTPVDYRYLPCGEKGPTYRKRAREKENAVLQAAIESTGNGMAAGIQMVEFWDEEVGVVLRVKQHGAEPKVWIVPDRSCFLMSDAGKTIDRI